MGTSAQTAEILFKFSCPGVCVGIRENHGEKPTVMPVQRFGLLGEKNSH